MSAVLAVVALQEFDKIKAMGLEPTLEALVYRLELRRGEVELAAQAIQVFRAGGAE